MAEQIRENPCSSMISILFLSAVIYSLKSKFDAVMERTTFQPVTFFLVSTSPLFVSSGNNFAPLALFSDKQKCLPWKQILMTSKSSSDDEIQAVDIHAEWNDCYEYPVSKKFTVCVPFLAKEQKNKSLGSS